MRVLRLHRRRRKALRLYSGLEPPLLLHRQRWPSELGEMAVPWRSRQFKLAKESELRIEVAEEASLRLRLLSGIAEIFGTELPPENWLDVPPRHKFAIFTWNGVLIKVNGSSEVEYVADEGRRVHAKSGTEKDSSQGSITIPGCIAATPIEMPINPVEGIPLEMPLVYFFGHTTPSVNPELYKAVVNELGKTVERQFTGNVESRAVGLVINTMGWVEGVGYELLRHSIDALNADVILVLGQEKLCSMLKDALKGKPNVDVVKLHKSGGVVPRNAKVRRREEVIE